MIGLAQEQGLVWFESHLFSVEFLPFWSPKLAALH